MNVIDVFIYFNVIAILGVYLIIFLTKGRRYMLGIPARPLAYSVKDMQAIFSTVLGINLAALTLIITIGLHNIAQYLVPIRFIFLSIVFIIISILLTNFCTKRIYIHLSDKLAAIGLFCMTMGFLYGFSYVINDYACLAIWIIGYLSFIIYFLSDVRKFTNYFKNFESK